MFNYLTTESTMLWLALLMLASAIGGVVGAIFVDWRRTRRRRPSDNTSATTRAQSPLVSEGDNLPVSKRLKLIAQDAGFTAREMSERAIGLGLQYNDAQITVLVRRAAHVESLDRLLIEMSATGISVPLATDAQNTAMRSLLGRNSEVVAGHWTCENAKDGPVRFAYYVNVFLDELTPELFDFYVQRIVREYVSANELVRELTEVPDELALN